MLDGQVDTLRPYKNRLQENSIYSVVSPASMKKRTKSAKNSFIILAKLHSCQTGEIL